MLTNWLQHTDFAYPWVLVLLLFIPLIAYVYSRRGKKLKASLPISSTRFINKTRTLKTQLKPLPFILRLLALAFLIVALARPRDKFTETETNGKGIDIVLCFDISGSMTERDFVPNRLEAAKEVATNFVQERPGDRIGITIFSNISFTLCPITTDHNMVLQQIQKINSGYLQEEGTAIGSGLATSIDRLQYSKAKSKIIILLTDGVDFGGKVSPDIATSMAKTFGIRVYTIGIGSNKQIEETVQTPFGPQVQKHQLEFNPALLKNIASQTGGQYFQAEDKESLQKIYSSINQLEKSDIKISTYNRYEEKFLPWLIIGLIFLFVEIIFRYTVLRRFP
ncbi:vWA domain-containing protein [Arachidicoccus soli]|uniref:VWA domain-containing protein n=1 Tax=Arachidicoccus soli TaxID=2341117 RepID=A0A386HKJ4_9BACT|nr:VWA domain-containing protein [Arachidicoccus soli]AYD46417.1 VWA domain-containing protein [Arachidicoccus soli]